MVGPSEADESDAGTDEATDAGDETGTESEAAGGRRVVEAGAGADVPLDGGGERGGAEPDGETDTSAEAVEAPTEHPNVASDGGGTDATDATDGDDEAVTFEDIADGDDSPGGEGADAAEEAPPTDGDDGADDGETAAEDAADSASDVPPELRALLSASDDTDVESLLDEVTGDSAAADDSAPSGAAATAAPTAEAADAEADGYGVADHHAEEPTDLATTEPGGEDLAPTEDAEEPAAETDPVSMRSEMSPALAERQAFLSLLVALGAGALFATVGNVLRLSRWQTLMLLVSAGIVVLLIATFVVFRAMLAAAERNDEPYRTAYTHPLFMFLFGVTTVVTGLFVGYVSRLVT